MDALPGRTVSGGRAAPPPADAPAWKVTFHRTVGWGLTGAVVVAVALLTIYVSFSTHR